MRTDLPIKNYSDFWKFYLHEHQNSTNRVLHVVGCFVGLNILYFLWPELGVASVVVSLVIGYAFAWTGHLVFEKNRPATWKYPLWSFISEFRMVALIVMKRKIRQKEF